MLIAWASIGALVGVAASQKKGSRWRGALGSLSFLLFFVSGITKSDDASQVKCPSCAEFIKAEAKA
jgi:hypothetical protein